MSRTTNDILISAFLILLLVWVVWEAREWPFRTRLFPWAIGFPLLALALIQLGLAAWSRFRERSNVATDEVPTARGPRANRVRSGHRAGLEVLPGQQSEAVVDPKVERLRSIAISAWALAFGLGFWLFGFKLGGPLLSLVFLRFQANESWKMSILFSLGIYLFFFVGFELALGVALAPGMITTSFQLQSFDWYIVNLLLDLIMQR